MATRGALPEVFFRTHTGTPPNYALIAEFTEKGVYPFNVLVALRKQSPVLFGANPKLLRLGMSSQLRHPSTVGGPLEAGLNSRTRTPKHGSQAA
jgi:hypothetical protein